MWATCRLVQFGGHDSGADGGTWVIHVGANEVEGVLRWKLFCRRLHLVVVIKREEGREWGTLRVIDVLGVETFHGRLHLAVH